MSRGRARACIALVSILAGGLVFVASEKPASVTTRYRPLALLERADMDRDLDVVWARLEASGYTLLQQEVITGSIRRTEEVPIGECLVAAAAPFGRTRVAAVRWVGRGPARAVQDERDEPYRRVVFQTVCPFRRSILHERPTVTFHVALHGHEGGATFMLFRGPPANVEDGPPILGDEERTIERAYTPAILMAIAVGFALLIILLMVESALRTRLDPADRDATLRRFTLALPAGLRGELEEITSQHLDAKRARALRDRLVELAPLVHSACFYRWRTDEDTIAARHRALLDEISTRRADARPATYRTGAEDLAVLTFLIRHRCELPELPSAIDVVSLELALQCSLPRDDGQLLSADVVWHPSDRVESLLPSQVERLFPEMVALGAEARSDRASDDAVPHSTGIENR